MHDNQKAARGGLFAPYLEDLHNRLVEAVRPVYRRGEVLFWGSEYRTAMRDAVRPVVGPMTVAQAWVFLRFVETVKFESGIAEDGIEDDAWESAENVAIEIMMEQHARDILDVDGRINFLRKHCVTEDSQVLVYTDDVFRRLATDIHLLWGQS